jgi:hypothetical protein
MKYIRAGSTVQISTMSTGDGPLMFNKEKGKARAPVPEGSYPQQPPTPEGYVSDGDDADVQMG